MTSYDNIRVRFSWQYDLDLIGLSCVEGFSISAWLKKAVVAYVRGDASFVVPVPDHPVFIDKNQATDCDFTLNKETEEDVIRVLSGFRTGLRNSAIKQIFRGFLSRPFLEPFFHDSALTVPTRRPKRKNWEYVSDEQGRRAVPVKDEEDKPVDVVMPPFPRVFGTDISKGDTSTDATPVQEEQKEPGQAKPKGPDKKKEKAERHTPKPVPPKPAPEPAPESESLQDVDGSEDIFDKLSNLF